MDKGSGLEQDKAEKGHGRKFEKGQINLRAILGLYGNNTFEAYLTMHIYGGNFNAITK